MHARTSGACAFDPRLRRRLRNCEADRMSRHRFRRRRGLYARHLPATGAFLFRPPAAAPMDPARVRRAVRRRAMGARAVLGDARRDQLAAVRPDETPVRRARPGCGRCSRSTRRAYFLLPDGFIMPDTPLLLRWPSRPGRSPRSCLLPLGERRRSPRSGWSRASRSAWPGSPNIRPFSRRSGCSAFSSFRRASSLACRPRPYAGALRSPSSYSRRR